MRWGWCLALLSGLMAPVQAQLPGLPPLPSLPQPVDPELQSCVARFGHTGCAARLYAQLLCRAVGEGVGSEQLEQQLAEQYEQAAIDFRGITPEQVETAAVRYYSPMLCPEKSVQIRQLFNPS
ncbi:MAG: hypothetical protein RLZZ11_975 [Cyanobacteriota bacterium]|jgi:hypothetical protein